MSAFNENDCVEWNWGNGTGQGQVEEIHTDAVEKVMDGATVRRDATPDCPAYTIEQDDGSRVLKAHTELRKAS